MGQILEANSNGWQKIRATSNSTNSGGLAVKVPTTTEPTGQGVLDLVPTSPGVGPAPLAFLLALYGVGANNDTFDAQVVGWRKFAGGTLWIPTPLLTVRGTLSSAVPGVAGSDIVATELFADTLLLQGTFLTNQQNISVELFSPTTDLGIAFLKVETKVCAKLEVHFNIVSGVTSCNGLISVF